MLKKTLCLLLTVAMLALVPVLGGCEKDEIKTQRHVEIHDQIIGQDTIVQ